MRDAFLLVWEIFSILHAKQRAVRKIINYLPSRGPVSLDVAIMSLFCSEINLS